jgi:hypothetical protein
MPYPPPSVRRRWHYDSDGGSVESWHLANGAGREAVSHLVLPGALTAIIVPELSVFATFPQKRFVHDVTSRFRGKAWSADGQRGNVRSCRVLRGFGSQVAIRAQRGGYVVAVGHGALSKVDRRC